MSFQSQLEPLRDNTRVVFNDRFIGDQGAKELAKFLADHRRVQSLEIKSNDISGEGFIVIFESLQKNQNLRQLILEYNNLGENQYEDWQTQLAYLVQECPKLERLNLSNNKITTEGFRRLIPVIANSTNLKMLEIRYNHINSTDIDNLANQLKKCKNDTLLYVELSGNKIKKQSIEALEAILKANRNKNPISKDKLLMTGGGFADKTHEISSNGQNTFYLNKTNAIDELSKENVLKHLQDILDQNRKDTAEIKIRLERELQDLLKREKNDARELQQLDNKCNQLIIQNRNLKFELDRTATEHQQMERDQEHHLRLHDEKLREANKELQDLQIKYEDVEERMQNQHDMKMKQIARDWEGRLRVVQEKIRTSENQNNTLENQIKKNLEKRERLRVEYLEEENVIRCKIEEQEGQKYGFRIASLQAKLREIEESREKFIRKNQDLIYQLEKTEQSNQAEVLNLEEELHQLKLKEEEFIHKNKDFLNRNEKLKSDINLKEITIEKLEEEVNRLNEEIELKKLYNREQVQKIIADNAYNRKQKENQKRTQIEKLNQLESSLRNSQLENAKLRQEYAILAQRLQVNLGKAVQDVFAENNLF